jgi:long-subunit fatty acid transport protein
MKRLLSSLAALTLCFHALSQNEVDALRYSYTPFVANSARSMGMGGAFGAFGADISSLFGNPAGLGQYKRYSFEMGLGVQSNTNVADYTGTNSTDSKSKLTLSNIGYVSSKKPKNTDWLNTNFSIGYAKTNSFNENISIRGKSSHTLLDVFARRATGVDEADIINTLPFDAGAAYYCYGIDPFDSIQNTYIASPVGLNINQNKSIERKGNQSETVIAYAGNYKDILLVGGSITFRSVNFSETATYFETYDSDKFLNTMSYSERLETSGLGVMLKLGAIVKPTPWLRAGLSYQSKCKISLTDIYSTQMNTTTDNQNFEFISPESKYTYSVRTPSKLLINAGFILGKFGLIAADYEFSDYGKIKMASVGTESNYSYNAENATIATIYRSTHKVRVGFESRILEKFRLRAGASYQQSPFVNGVSDNTPVLGFSAGAGYFKDAFFLDLGTNYIVRNETYYLFDPTVISPTTITKSSFSILVNIGFRY